MAENNGSLAEVQLTVAVDKKKYFNQLKKMFQDSQTECDNNALTVTFQSDRASIENIIKQLDGYDFSANVTLESNVAELKGHLEDVLAHMDMSVPVTADTSALDKKLAEEENKLEELKKKQRKSAAELGKEIETLFSKTTNKNFDKNAKEALRLYNALKAAGGNIRSVKEQKVRDFITEAQGYAAYVEFAEQNPIKFVDEAEIQAQIKVIEDLKQEIEKTKQSAREAGSSGTGAGGNGSARVATEPDVNAEEFARKVSEQLTTPAKIEVTGVVSDPKKFADDVSAQLTVPAEIQIDASEANGTSADNTENNLEILRRSLQMHERLETAIKNFNSALKDTAAYLYDVNNQEERMMLLRDGVQVGKTLVQNNGHVGIPLGELDALKPDTIAHSHQFDAVFNNLRFSTDDLVQATARDYIERLILSCGDQVLELGFAGLKPEQKTAMIQEMTDTYTSVFALFGASVNDDGTISNPKSSMTSEVYNQAVEVVNSMMYKIAERYGSSFNQWNAADYGDEFKNIPFTPLNATITEYIKSMGLALSKVNLPGVKKLQADFTNTLNGNLNAKGTPEQTRIEVTGTVSDPKEFASDVTKQLTSPAQIEVVGTVDSPEAFANEISKQLTSPVSVSVAPDFNNTLDGTKNKADAVQEVMSTWKAEADAFNDKFKDTDALFEKFKKQYADYRKSSWAKVVNDDYHAAYSRLEETSEEDYEKTLNAFAKKLPKSQKEIQRYIKNLVENRYLEREAYEQMMLAAQSFSGHDYYSIDQNGFNIFGSRTSKEKMLNFSKVIDSEIITWSSDLGVAQAKATDLADTLREIAKSAGYELEQYDALRWIDDWKLNGATKDFSVIKELIDHNNFVDAESYKLIDVDNIEEAQKKIGELSIKLKSNEETLLTENLDYDAYKALSNENEQINAQITAYSRLISKVERLKAATGDKSTSTQDANKFSKKVTEKLNEPAQIPIEGIVNNPVEFADNISKQLTSPATIDVELGNIVEESKAKLQEKADDVTVNIKTKESAEETSEQTQSAGNSIEDEGEKARIALNWKKEFAEANKSVAQASEETTEQTQSAGESIKDEGENAKKALKWKKEFAKANKAVAQASEETAEKTKEAAEGVEDEGDAAKKAAEDSKSFAENADLQRYLKEIQEGTNTVQFGISIDKEMAEAELKKIAPEIAKSFNEKYGTNLTGAQVVKAYKASLKEQQSADEAALQAHLEVMEKRTRADNEAFQKQVQNWNDYIQQTENARQENEEYRQLRAYDDAMAYANQQAADELEYQQKLAMYKAQGAAQIQEIIAEEKEHAAWVEEVCKKQEESNALMQKQLDEAEQLAVYDMAMEYAHQQAAEEAEYLKKRNEYLEYGRQQQQEYLRQAQEIARTFDDADKAQELSSTQHNKEAAKAYDKLFSSAKEYYNLLMKQEKGSLSANESARLLQLQDEWDNATSAVGKYSIETDGAVDSINRATAAQARFNDEAQNSSTTGVLKDLQSSYDKIQNMMGSGKYTSAFIAELSEVQNMIREIMNTPIDLDDENFRRKLVDMQRKIDETIGKKAFSDVKKAASSSLSKLELQINEFTTQNTGMGLRFRQQFENLRIRLTDAKSVADVEKLAGSITKLKSEVESAGRATRSFFDILKERVVGVNAQAIAQYFSWQDWIRYIRQMATTVTQLDTALTEMRKVSDDSLTSLQAYQRTTFETADAVGTTALALQQSTADWMRLGEAQEQAAKSAQAATILMNVSEFQSIDEATQSLVAVSQAYKDIDKMDIIDVINNIGNNYSVATNELAEGLQNAAAVLKTQGNDLNEAVALLTAGNAITQDISKTSAGIRTISLRIAGTQEAKDQLAELGEEVDDFIVQTESKTQKLIKDYTAVASNAYKGIDVLDANGNLRNTYDILLDIARIYKEIQAEDLKAGTNRAQALVEYIAGKNRSNIAASILLNPGMLENVYNSAIDSTGSAERELNKYLESIEGHVARFQTQLQELEFDFLDSDTVKTFINLGTGALSVIDSIVDSLGMLGTLGTAAAIAAATRNFGGAKSCSHKIRRKSGFPYGYISFLMTKCEIHMGKTKRQYAGNCLHCYYSPTLMWTM